MVRSACSKRLKILPRYALEEYLDALKKKSPDSHSSISFIKKLFRYRILYHYKQKDDINRCDINNRELHYAED
jgi:hypothetical protein